tara:strand:+ start:2147 stop:2563 length:417 start_codon:yes stop_codon:yes gene_type:complete
MKNSKVVNIQASGNWKELYKFEVELDNGDIGTLYRKSKDSKLTNGQDISYTINDKGTLKIVTDYQKNNQSQSSPKQDDVQKLIVKQSSLKAAVDYDNKCTPEDVLKNAQMFYEWVWGLTPTQSKINKVAEKIDSDLPF